MIVLDTNVFSVLMQQAPDPILVRWMNQNRNESVWTTSITILEVRFGIELLPLSRRRERLELTFIRNLKEDLQERILDLDREAAHQAARLAARRRRVGRPVEFRDMEIAGIVASRNATLATRNLRDFDNLGIDLVDPWRASTQA